MKNILILLIGLMPICSFAITTGELGYEDAKSLIVDSTKLRINAGVQRKINVKSICNATEDQSSVEIDTYNYAKAFLMLREDVGFQEYMQNELSWIEYRNYMYVADATLTTELHIECLLVEDEGETLKGLMKDIN